jgi:hypothetical protein
MAITVVHRSFPLGGINISQRAYNDTTDDVPAHAAIPKADTDYGLAYAACTAANDNAVKASAGVLYGLVATGTGTAGTVALKDGGTTFFTASIPATAGIYPIPIPIYGITFGTNIHVVTTGTGVTAFATFL